MAKRISCRVVRTVPLSTSNEALRHVDGSNNKHPKADNVTAANVSRSRNSVREPKTYNLALGILAYTGRLGTARVSVNDGPIGWILDCYV